MTDEDFERLLDQPHPTARDHKPMPRLNRAAQFSPFAALTGYEDAVEEVARQTTAEQDIVRSDFME